MHKSIILLNEREISDKVINSAQNNVFWALCETVKKKSFITVKNFLTISVTIKFTKQTCTVELVERLGSSIEIKLPCE